ncbi:MAG: PDDEXK nuclease domain-containing protein [Oscillospiraceae bacterium]|jgi:predicted nuclease of restriction endonuclease-like (RecB) superfamily|nr:PDDEXK nuclease domain-containing protein [Oscillospiraceae bacterium]
MDLINYEQKLFDEISILIEQSRRTAYAQTKRITVYLFWQIGKHINADIIENKRADYGKQIVLQLATQLRDKYGRTFELRNIRRMMQFAEQFSDFEIVSAVTTQLSWTHFVEVLPLKTQEAKLFYLNEAAKSVMTTRDFRKLINRKAFERKEIANTQITVTTKIPLNAFKDPYLFDILGLKEEHQEEDLEEAILRELEKFILEFGKGLTFVERQKRMIIDGNDYHVDLLFYSRDLKRLIAVELKLGKFEADYNGQMKLYLGWLDKYDRREGEEAPIGLILCTKSSREQIELLKLDKDRIVVAEYWTALPPKKELEEKIQTLLIETKERLERKKLLP